MSLSQWGFRGIRTGLGGLKELGGSMWVKEGYRGSRKFLPVSGHFIVARVSQPPLGLENFPL